ncbi:Transcriptional corepressor SEUSS [Sesamum alatum]|uniref:Transcriptional corepressor SEUSS n=1 Tax=Sesamum alatum TaxID=300844 RepID=A0AAE2CC38_9LAMI|nr:Transcriptional corepressor SEUSS [Sesamum alatum]
MESHVPALVRSVSPAFTSPAFLLISRNLHYDAGLHICFASAEISQELLPRLHKVKYDTGASEEHLHIESSNEHQGACGRIFLHYPKAAEESVYDQVRIVRYGQLRVVFSPDLKICSWEFCSQNHEEYIRRSSLIPQVCELGAAVQNYQHSARHSSSVAPQNYKSALIPHQMVEALGMPFISQIGIVKRYVRCLQISEVLNFMNDLIDYSQENRLAPKESIATFPRFGSNASPGKNAEQEPKQQQSPAACLAPHFGALVGARSTSGFYGDRLANTTASTSTGTHEHKRQRTGPSSAFAKTPAHTTSVGFLTPLFGIHPQGAPTALGKSGPGSAAENVHLERKTSVSLQQPSNSNLAGPHNPPSTVDRIIQEVMAAQPHTGAGSITGVSDAENRIGIMPTGSNALGNYTCVGNSVASNRINYIDVENYESRNNGIGSSAPTIGTTSGARMDMVVDVDANLDMFHKDAKGKYLPKEYDDLLFDQFEDFESLHELLK